MFTIRSKFFIPNTVQWCHHQNSQGFKVDTLRWLRLWSASVSQQTDTQMSDQCLIDAVACVFAAWVGELCYHYQGNIWCSLLIREPHISLVTLVSICHCNTIVPCVYHVLSCDGHLSSRLWLQTLVADKSHQHIDLHSMDIAPLEWGIIYNI